ncbi:MAG TPA: hypothetical protein VG222_07110 [Vicinamibacterales bacterium]|jgi:hypothetical protein|nr:hypothetical protein [Vicinamibacterales bacterium]
MGRTLAAVLALTATIAAQGAYDKLLTIADVEKVAGMTGVRTVPNGSQAGAGGMLNFARGDGKLILMVNFGDAQLYRKARDTKEIEIGGKKYPNMLFAHDVPGLGDEAFASPPGRDQFAIYARKGSKAITVSTYYPGVGEGVKPVLTEAQLKAIAQLIFSRE